MTEPIIEELIKAYDEKLVLMDIALSQPGPIYPPLTQRLHESSKKIKALTKDYRERRRYTNVYNPEPGFVKRRIDIDSKTYEEAINSASDSRYLETIEIIRNKP